MCIRDDRRNRVSQMIQSSGWYTVSYDLDRLVTGKPKRIDQVGEDEWTWNDPNGIPRVTETS